MTEQEFKDSQKAMAEAKALIERHQQEQEYNAQTLLRVRALELASQYADSAKMAVEYAEVFMKFIENR